MHSEDISPWQHAHVFGQDKKTSGERRTFFVTVITFLMMVVEIAAGIVFGSMALLADGLHMASHAAALSINTFAYRYTRAHAGDRRFNFGSGKVNTLGGFTSAVLLGFFALFMFWESAKRFFHPVAIEFDQAILVAVVGLVVNLASVFILETRHHHEHDHNLRSAYLHVLADALTSVLAIVALLCAKYSGLVWMDPLMGIIGGLLVFRWSIGLSRTTSRILLDETGPEEIQRAIKQGIEKDGDSKVTDLHLWSVGAGVYSVIVSVVACRPLEASEYKKRLPAGLGLVHITVETSACGKEHV